MYTEVMLASRIRIIALSQIRQIREKMCEQPSEYKKNTAEYCFAMYEILQTMPGERLEEIVKTVREGYEAVGFVDDALLADGLVDAIFS